MTDLLGTECASDHPRNAIIRRRRDAVQNLAAGIARERIGIVLAA